MKTTDLTNHKSLIRQIEIQLPKAISECRFHCIDDVDKTRMMLFMTLCEHLQAFNILLDKSPTHSIVLLVRAMLEVTVDLKALHDDRNQIYRLLVAFWKSKRSALRRALTYMQKNGVDRNKLKLFNEQLQHAQYCLKKYSPRISKYSKDDLIEQFLDGSGVTGMFWPILNDISHANINALEIKHRGDEDGHIKLFSIISDDLLEVIIMNLVSFMIMSMHWIIDIVDKNDRDIFERTLAALNEKWSELLASQQTINTP